MMKLVDGEAEAEGYRGWPIGLYSNHIFNQYWLVNWVNFRFQLTVNKYWSMKNVDRTCWAAVHGDHYVTGTFPGAGIVWGSM